MKKFVLAGLAGLGLTLTSGQALALGSPTTTSVRCWYKVDDANTSTRANYEWALDPASGRYYVLRGNWYGTAPIMNVFYTDTSQAELTSVCKDTLARKNRSQPLVQVSAADYFYSFDYMIWSQDSATPSTAINKVVVFGDSVSDTGNLFNAVDWKAPAPAGWFHGRFSNGKVWDEYLTDNLGLPNYNWAMGGSAADWNGFYPGVTYQVDSYISYMEGAANYRPANTLFTLLVGANDIINNGLTGQRAIDDESRALDKLIGSGARNILVLNLPDLTRAPLFTYFRNDQVAIKAQIDDFNARQPGMIAELKAKWGSTLNIQLLDVNAKVQDMLDHPSSYNVTNTRDACLNLTSSDTSNYATSQTASAACTNADSYLFWDNLHPTTHSHKIIADYATNFVRQNFLSPPKKRTPNLAGGQRMWTSGSNLDFGATYRVVKASFKVKAATSAISNAHFYLKDRDGNTVADVDLYPQNYGELSREVTFDSPISVAGAALYSWWNPAIAQELVLYYQAPFGAQCASENGRCSFSGTKTVAYGANDTFRYLTLTGGADCNNSTFGDPLYGVVKACYLVE